MIEELSSRYEPAVSDLVDWMPRVQRDFCEPEGAHKHEAFFMSASAESAEEAEPSRDPYRRAGFFENLATQSLLPCLVAFGAPAWKVPPHAV